MFDQPASPPEAQIAAAPARLSARRLAVFAAMGMPLTAVEAPLSTYVPPLYASAFGFNLATIGAIFLAARLWDAIIDPAIGLLSDRSRSRWGRRRPWIAAGAVIFAMGAVPVFVPLRPPHWHYDRAAIEAALTPRTRAMIINDPLNPTGSVMDAATRAMIAAIAVAHDLFVICDEVWETVRFDGGTHVSLLAEPGMATRTVKIGSAGKIFGATGWKVGWMVAAPDVAAVLAKAHQFLTFTTPPMLQWAVAEGLGDDGLIDATVAGWAASRAVLNQGLAACGFAVMPGVATWVTCIDLAASAIALDDRTVAGRMVREAGVASIPLSALWEGCDAPRHVLRLCHCKPAAMLDEAIGRIARWRERLIQS